MRRARYASAAFVSAALACADAVAPLQSQSSVPSRTVVVIGDLHMGVGRDAAGAWHASEDFRWAPEFAAFLKAVDADGKGSVDLILNGDTFELWQPRGKDCTQRDPGLGCTEAEARARLDRVLAAHGEEIAALVEFARKDTNRVVLVPGDHDAALLFPGVARRTLDSFSAAAGRVQIAASGRWASADGSTLVEHGHQIGFSPNRFGSWPQPWVQRNGREYLERTWGEQLVQGYYNIHENRYPIADNVADEGAGVKFVLAAEAEDAGPSAAHLLRYFLFKMSWQQFRMDLDEGEPEAPKWDLAEIRAEGPAFLLQSLPSDDPFRPLAARALADGRLAFAMTPMTDEAIVAVCDYRAAIRRARRRLERFVTQLPAVGPAVAECPRTPETKGSAFEYYWRSRDAIFARHLHDVQKAGGKAPAVFVHGHTHLADRGFSVDRKSGLPIVINAGAWQRTITPVQLDEMTTRKGAAADLLRTLQPEQLAPCYSYVQIPLSTDRPEPVLRYWRRSEAGEWGSGGGCTR